MSQKKHFQGFFKEKLDGILKTCYCIPKVVVYIHVI